MKRVTEEHGFPPDIRGLSGESLRDPAGDRAASKEPQGGHAQ